MNIVTSIIFFLTTGLLFSQESISLSIKDSLPITADIFIGVDDFNNIYYIKDNIFHKKTASKVFVYNNLQLGAISSVDILNPLDITVFYSDFNTVIKLDNTLNETVQIRFSEIQSFRNVQYVSTAINKSLWIFNTDIQQPELFDYQQKNILSINQPITEDVIAWESNYNFCWALTINTLYQYNIYGSLLQKIALNGFDDLHQSSENLVLKKKNKLFYIKKGSYITIPIKLPVNISIKDFYLRGDNLYIYNNKKLYHFILNLNQPE
ncbi:hypothetical protein [Leptobacterium sp. I13]|uniref:hypothetical protein n=1 Tax=Leptobacterium meishanense TaxID=3128904 RepID=UPI0030ED5C5A